MLPYVLSNYKPVFKDSSNILLCSACFPWVLCWRVKCVGSGSTPSNTFLLNDYWQPFKWMSAWEKIWKTPQLIVPLPFLWMDIKNILYHSAIWNVHMDIYHRNWFDNLILADIKVSFLGKGGPFEIAKNGGSS